MFLSPQIHLVFENFLSLLFIAAIFLGILAWITYIALTQHKIVKKLGDAVTREELKEAFAKLKEELQRP